jgi:hypothetical protein
MRTFFPPPAACAAVATLAAAGPASAHVKWFSRDADCAMPPLSPLQVMTSPEFLWLGLVAFVAVWFSAWLDGRLSQPGARAWAMAGRLDDLVAPLAPRVLRLSLAVFFVVSPLYFDEMPVLLTPELQASHRWVPLLQAAIALALLWRPSAWLGAAGIVVLYGMAVSHYGWFHLLDYPVFLAAAGAVALDSLGRGRHTALALALLRAGAGVTLMWAGAEKWLYPWWSDGVLDGQLAGLRGSMSNPFVMAAAGWVEFCCAYALVFGRLGTQAAAAVLLVPFVAAVPVFGVVDAIGHAPIIVVLVLLAATRSRLPQNLQQAGGAVLPWRRATSCALAALATIGLYWGLQALAYRGGRLPPEAVMLPCLLVAPLALWWMPRLRVFAGVTR